MIDNADVHPKPLPFWQRIFSSLRYRDYRLIWLGSCTEHMGQHMETMAVAWLMMELTNSPYYLGLLAVCKVAPLIIFALVGGVLTDRVDRRNLLINCLMGGAIISIALLFLVLSGLIAPWHLLVATVLASVLTGMNHPARAAIIPNITPKDEWMNAIALDSISVRTASIITSPIAGFMIAGFGTASLFGVRALGMGLAMLWLLMAKVPATPTGGKKHSSWHDMSRGLVYATTSGAIMSLVIVFALREFQVETSTVFMPFFADNILHAGASGYGYLNMAQGLGAMVGLFGIATLGNFRYKGWLIIGSGIFSGVFLSLFPLSNWLILSLLLLFVVNAAGTIFENVSRTVLQIIVPDEMRGRVMSLREFTRGVFGTWIAFGLGLAGEYLGVVTASVLLGVFLLVSVSLLALLLPSLRRL
jgi:MFS family permease